VAGAEPSPFGARLRRLRESAGLTQEALAERAGLSAKGIAALERGRSRRPYPHTIAALADALGLVGDDRAALTGADREAAARGADRPPLPVPPTPLIGREGDLAALGALLGDGARLVTLTGPGGVGKTRLALALAAAVAPDFPDGGAFAPLAPLGDAALVPRAIAGALGLPEEGSRSTGALLRDALQGRRLLLVLDNCEHVLAMAPALAELLAACQGLAVLATSRSPLRLRGEREWAVAPLALPELARLPAVAEVAESPAVRLFVDRAREVVPGFALAQQDAAAVAAICRRLDGLPLALELAAARLRLLSPTELLARLDRALPLLVDGPRDLPARQRTMRDAIAWSHDLLGPDEQRLFRRLAAFAGGWTLAAAEAVGGETALHHLSALVEQSLVLAERGEGEVRYRLLEPVREYAREQLAVSGEAEVVRGGHTAFYRALAEAAAAHLLGPGQQAWLDRLGAEVHNLRASVRSLLDGGDAAGAVDLVWSLWRFWRLTGRQREAHDWVAEALASAGASLPPSQRGRALLIVGMILFEAEAPGARETLGDALRLCREAGDAQCQVMALGYLGRLAVAAGEFTRAQVLFEENLRLARDEGAAWGVAFALINLGILPLLRGDYPAAVRWFAESLATADAAGDRVGIHRSRYYLGLLAWLRGDASEASAHLAAGLVIAGALRDRTNAGYFLRSLAGIAVGGGRPTEAAQLLGAAEALLQASGALPYRYAPERAWHEQAAGAVRAALGEAAFAAACSQGRALSLEEAVELALAAVEPRPRDDRLLRTSVPSTASPPMRPREGGEPASAGALPERLTARELEVLRLAADGLANADIAARLSIGVGTVKTHVNRLFAKLGATSRTQAVARARALGLLAD
jgi:predicted ATPase/DNA-binding CsgD family transcriptional regulator/transcriptional regulator with XRE-family HTH domain